MLTGGTPGALTLQHPLQKLSIQTAQEDYVGDFIFPPFHVKKRTGTYLEVTRDTTHRVLNTRVANGERPKEIEVGGRMVPFACEDYGLGSALKQADLEEMDLGDMRREAVIALANDMALAREWRIAIIAGNTALVPNTTAALIDASGFPWSNINGTPINDILEAKRLVNTRTQEKANAITMTYSTMLDMLKTTQWRDTYRFTEVGIRQRIFEGLEGLRAMGLEPRIAGICGLETEEGTPSDPDVFSTIWGRSVLVFKRVPVPTKRTNCFGFQPNTRLQQLKKIRSGRDDEAEIVERWTCRSTIDEHMVNANCAQLITAT